MALPNGKPDISPANLGPLRLAIQLNSNTVENVTSILAVNNTRCPLNINNKVTAVMVYQKDLRPVIPI